MNLIFGWIGLGAAVILVIWLAWSGNAAQASCELNQRSPGECFATLNP